MRRRDFLTQFAGAATWTSWPLAASAQQPERLRRIGTLTTNRSPGQERLYEFKRGLAERGWLQNRNMVFEERRVEIDPEGLRASATGLAAATELAALQPDLIFVSNSTSLRAMRRAAGVIPIVFASVADPVNQGFIATLEEPGGNVTGFAANESSLAAKHLELLKKILPDLTHAVFMYDPQQPTAVDTFDEVERTAASLSVQVKKTPVVNGSDVEVAIDSMAQMQRAGLVVGGGPSTTFHRELIVTMAMRRRMPVVHQFRYFGALASYGADDFDLCRRSAIYAHRILKGEKPIDLPVQLPARLMLVLNLKAAKAMDLVLSPEVLALADEVLG
jgi:putative ABC transport system substrate-binding protein